MNYTKQTEFHLSKWSELTKNGLIDKTLYDKYQVNRGLRDLNGNGVLTGLTEISEIVAKENVDGELRPANGKLFYRGYDVESLVAGFTKEKRFGFEETAYLLLFNRLPNATELAEFTVALSEMRSLPTSFVRDCIMKSPSVDMMNAMARSVLMLYSYDKKAEDTSIPNVLRQCMELTAKMSELALYSFQVADYYHGENTSLVIHDPDPDKTTAENILHMLRKDSRFTPLEAELLDLSLVLHAEHGGGNNSSFTMHVVTSSGTDTYSAFAASLGSLKGPKHGGANIKVCQMFDDMKKQVSDYTDEEEVAKYLNRILEKDAFDKSGLIYGVGHAIYSKSDPRAEVFKGFVRQLAEEKGLQKEFALYETVERLAPRLISARSKMYKGVSVNVDFYSGFVYRMLGIPEQLFTPLFAVARSAGWSAHRIEELLNGNRIIRPAYKSVLPRKEYIPIEKREKE